MAQGEREVALRRRTRSLKEARRRLAHSEDRDVEKLWRLVVDGGPGGRVDNRAGLWITTDAVLVL